MLVGKRAIAIPFQFHGENGEKRGTVEIGDGQTGFAGRGSTYSASIKFAGKAPRRYGKLLRRIIRQVVGRQLQSPCAIKSSAGSRMSMRLFKSGPRVSPL